MFLDCHFDGGDCLGVQSTSKSQSVANSKLGGGSIMIFWYDPKVAPLVWYRSSLQFRTRKIFFFEKGTKAQKPRISFETWVYFAPICILLTQKIMSRLKDGQTDKNFDYIHFYTSSPPPVSFQCQSEMLTFIKVNSKSQTTRKASSIFN